MLQSAFIRRCALLSGLGLCVLLAGCNANSQPRVVDAAPKAQSSLMLDQVKSLAGTWDMVDDKGGTKPGVVYSVFANGSAVREVMFPGSDHEMTNIYHMDGSSLVVTHYCAQGNQPRMRCTAATPGQLPFVFDSVTNMTARDQSYMGGLTLVIMNPTTLQQKWRTMNPPEGHPAEMTFTLKRRA
ncbi:MAG: hypothetical protein ACT4PL_05060 [Phycisphaerales bacterium]